MNPKEFKQLNIAFLESLSNICADKGYSCIDQQISQDTTLFFINAGYHKSETEVYELFNNGERAEWRFAGIQQKRK